MSQLTDPESWPPEVSLDERLEHIRRRCAILEDRMHRQGEEHHDSVMKVVAKLLDVSVQELAAAFTDGEVEKAFLTL